MRFYKSKSTSRIKSVTHHNSYPELYTRLDNSSRTSIASGSYYSDDSDEEDSGILCKLRQKLTGKPNLRLVVIFIHD